MAILEKSLLVLWVMVLIVTEAKHHTRSRQECTAVRGTTCTEDSDCKCLNQHQNSPLICNYFLRCKEKSFWDIIWRKLPCRGVYKSACKVEDDCECSEAPLTCEDNECVKAKFVPA